jgi:mannose-1-phosphate guanylyltransferase/mannose-6-phosphate isomerase
VLIRPVLLSGGSGTRLWPLSRALAPKQLMKLVSGRSLLQETALRVADRTLFETPFCLCNEEHRFAVAEQLTEIGAFANPLLLEPEGRNTAPATAVAALAAAERDPEALVLMLASDHAIADVPAFHAALRIGMVAARAGRIVTFGIRPDAPETGYGYIALGDELAEAPGTHAVARFIEKPDAERAAAMIAAGGHVWNGGIFMFRADVMLAEFERLEPELLAACRAALAATSADGDFRRLDRDAFARARKVSVDYAIMEHTALAAVVPVAMGWSDVGSFSALAAVRPADAAGNVVIGDVVVEGATGSYLHSTGPLVAALGVHDMVIVATGDAVLVVPKDRAQDVGKLVERLKASGRTEVRNHPLVHRPWGSYQTIDLSDRFQVKRLMVKPGAAISLQYHHHRAEHWVVVAGTAEVRRGDETIILHENESTYIPHGMIHRLANPGRIPLQIIEVQSGSYLGEDDIVRLSDTYGRVPG